MLDSLKFKPLSTNNILELIEVDIPYFALNDFYLDNGWLVAKAPVECPSMYESCLMNASEVGRHLAILGSCSGALINPKQSKHYYLANQAKLETYPRYISNIRPEYLWARAKAKFVNKRELHAETELLDLDGEICARLGVKYHVLAEKSFKRLYSNDITEFSLDLPKSNPYERFINLEIQDQDDKIMKTSIGIVKPEMCMGHFNDVKALPVAILSQCFLNSSYMFLSNKINEDKLKFVLKSCDLEATALATTGQYVNIQVEYVESINNLFTTRCVATNLENETVGEMLCLIERV